jgi:hypothetical protein
MLPTGFALTATRSFFSLFDIQSFLLFRTLAMSSTGSQRSPSLPSYSEIEPAPLPASPPALSEKFDPKTETKTFIINIEALSQSEHGGEKQATTAARTPCLPFRYFKAYLSGV